MKSNINKRYSILLAVALFLPLACFAQFTGKSEIPTVEQDGYYHILISPDVLAMSAQNLSDVRVKDAAGVETPYLFRTDNTREVLASFEALQLTQNTFVRSDSATVVVVENSAKEELNQLCIIIQSADIRKYVSIRGSDDGTNWYIVKQRTPLLVSISKDDTEEALVVDFPKGRYRYYEIRISNPENEPIRVLKAGRHRYSEIFGKYMEVELVGFVQKDSSNKRTYLHFPALEKNYFVDKIGFDIRYQFDYYRSVRLLQTSEETSSQTWVINSFSLSSKSQNTAHVDNRINKNTWIEIENNDNPPLAINRITIYQLHRYITVYLEKDKRYTLFFGNKKLSKPQYDIVHFEKDIPYNLPLLETETLQKIPVVEELETSKKVSFFESTVFLWTVIIVVGLLLLLMCWQVIRKK